MFKRVLDSELVRKCLQSYCLNMISIIKYLRHGYLQWSDACNLTSPHVVCFYHFFPNDIFLLSSVYSLSLHFLREQLRKHAKSFFVKFRNQCSKSISLAVEERNVNSQYILGQNILKTFIGRIKFQCFLLLACRSTSKYFFQEAKMFDQKWLSSDKLILNIESRC